MIRIYSGLPTLCDDRPLPLSLSPTQITQGKNHLGFLHSLIMENKEAMMMDCFLLSHVEPFNLHPKRVLISQQWLSCLAEFMAKTKPNLQWDEFLEMLADLET